MPHPQWTKEQAQAYASLGAKVRWDNERARKAALDAKAAEIKAFPETAPESFATELAIACNETLDKLRNAADAREMAQLARALRDLRETWHLATGKPRAGLIKHEESRKPRRELPKLVSPIDYSKGASENTQAG